MKHSSSPLRKFLSYLFLLWVSSSLLSCGENPSANTSQNSISVSGLQEDVEIIRDSIGINHIYANNQHDLFFAQGYAAARDRLFQFEIWRRQATGTVAEILGESHLKRDMGTRLFKFRGDMQEEMNYYHEDGSEIIQAYVDGVNAYIEEVQNDPSKLTLPFQVLGITPQKWTPEVVISRHQGLLGNIGQELEIGRAVALLGPERVKELSWFHPKDPDLTLDPRLTYEVLSQDILGFYSAYRRSVRFTPEDLLEEYRTQESVSLLEDLNPPLFDQKTELWKGSNNWVISPSKTASGKALMANDPHRTVAIPSLRYMVHLNAPGWNVIGGGEPEIPGVSIGHNDYGAWGLTVFRTDGEDLLFYELNPENLKQYKYQGEWRDMTVIEESIPVKGQDPVSVELLYTHHGPVTFIDSVRNMGFAVRCAWMEPGGSPYLASLRMDQAKNWEEFREACNYSHIPGENMIWADTEGNIGWQAVGIAPVRTTHSGLVPVAGNGSFEWSGYLEIKEKPHAYNPANGIIATANENVTPSSYTRWNAIGYSWSDPYRGARVREVLEGSNDLTMEEMQRLQTDYLSIPARQLVPLLLSSQIAEVEEFSEVIALLTEWKYELSPQSVAAGIYVAWENQLADDVFEHFTTPKEREAIDGTQLFKTIEWLTEIASGEEQEELIKNSFLDALEQLQGELGEDVSEWAYGQAKYKHSRIIHPLGGVVNDSLQTIINTESLPRGGNSFTPGATGGNNRQTHGATFKMIVEAGNWDEAVGTNSPGQSGDPKSPFYKNLFSTWAKDGYFPIYFSREKVDSYSYSSETLTPVQSN